MYFLQNSIPQRARIGALLCLFLIGGCSVAVAGQGDEQYAAAAQRYADGSWTKAIAAFEAFAKEHPQHPRALDARFFVGEALLQTRQYDKARGQFLDFLQQAPEHANRVQAQFRAAEALYLAQDREAASRELAAFSEQHPKAALNVYALAYLAEIELDAGRFDKAAAIYRDSEKRFPEGPLKQETRFGLARALEGLGQNEDALRLFRSVVEQATSPLADSAALRAGVVLYERGDFDDAVRQLALFENDFAASKLQPQARYWIGLATLDAGRAQDALKIFETATRTAGDSEILPGLWFGSARAKQALGDEQAAIEHYQRIVDQWPQCPWADNSLHALLEAAFQQGDAEQFAALAARFKQQGAGGDMAPRIKHLLGREALRRHDYQSAIERFASIVAEDQSEAFTKSNLYYLSVARLGAGDIAEALQVADGIEAQPGEVGLRRNLLILKASAQFELQNNSEATSLLTACLREPLPADQAGECRAKLAICQARAGDVAALRTTLGQMRRHDTDAAVFLPTVAYIAELMTNRNETDLARELYALLTLDGTPHEWVSKGLANLGRLQLERGEVAESAKTFNRLLSKAASSSEAAEAALLQARALEQADQPDAAVAVYRQVAEQYAGQDAAAIALFEAAKLQDRLKQDRDAAELLRKLLAEAPEFEHIDAVLYQLAWVLTDLQQEAPAEAAFAKLLQDFPQSNFRHDVLYRLAERAFDAGDAAKAAQHLRQLLAEEVKPRLLGHGLYLQGQVAAKQGNWAEVIPPMQRIVAELPDHKLWLPANYWIAEAHFRSGDYDQAAKEFDSLAEATDDSQADWVAMVLLRSAQVAAHQNRWLDAIESARSVAARFPEFRLQHEADYMIGRALSARGRFSEARDAFGRVIRSPLGSHTETAAMAQWMIGESFFHQKEFRYALRAYQRVISLHAYPRWQSAALLQSGKCHEALGEWQQALKQYAELIQQHPTSEFAEVASSRMRIARREADSTTLR